MSIAEDRSTPEPTYTDEFYAEEMRRKQEWFEAELALKGEAAFFDEQAMRELYIVIHPAGEVAEECPGST